MNRSDRFGSLSVRYRHTPSDQIRTETEMLCCQMPHQRLVKTMQTMEATGTANTKKSHARKGTSAMRKALNSAAAITKTSVTDSSRMNM